MVRGPDRPRQLCEPPPIEHRNRVVEWFRYRPQRPETERRVVEVTRAAQHTQRTIFEQQAQSEQQQVHAEQTTAHRGVATIQ